MSRKDKNVPGLSTEEADEAMSQIAAQAASLTTSGKIGTELDNQRNELLWKITAQIDETKSNLEQAEMTMKSLKKHLSQLESLKKILAS